MAKGPRWTAECNNAAETAKAILKGEVTNKVRSIEKCFSGKEGQEIAEPLADCRTRPPFVMMALIQSVLTKAVPYGMMTKAAGLEEDQQVKEKSPSEIPCHRNQQKVLMKP